MALRVLLYMEGDAGEADKNREMKKENSYTHVLKYTGLFGGVQGLNIAITLIRNKFVALLLGPAGMGLVSLFNTVVNFFSQATNLGISFSAVRHISELFDNGTPEEVAHFVKIVRGWSLLTALAGMLLLAMLGPTLSSSVFSWGNHTLHFILLSPIVAILAITGGETAILKGARRLKPLAIVQVVTMVAALAISLPVYYVFGVSGIVPVLVMLATVTMIVTMRFSCRLYPYTIRGAKGVLGEGMEMVRLGVAFVLAGVFGSGAELAIRTFLNLEGDLDIVGLYNAAYMLTITYAGMVFSAMETDYFPRLSAIAADRVATNDTVNRQIEISLLLVSPMLVALIVFLPIIMPLLYSSRFMAIVGMAQIAVFSMYFKAIVLPIEYINLAKSDSRSYLAIELFYDVIIVLLIVCFYRRFGLWGTGLALTVAHLLNLIVVLVYAKIRYGFSLSRGAVAYCLAQLPLGVMAYGFTFIGTTWMQWTAEIAIVVASCAISLYIIAYKKTSLWNKLKNKISHHA